MESFHHIPLSYGGRCFLNFLQQRKLYSNGPSLYEVLFQHNEKAAKTLTLYEKTRYRTFLHDSLVSFWRSYDSLPLVPPLFSKKERICLPPWKVSPKRSELLLDALLLKINNNSLSTQILPDWEEHNCFGKSSIRTENFFTGLTVNYAWVWE